MRMHPQSIGMVMILLAMTPVIAQASTIQEVQYTFFAQLGGNAVESAQFVVPEFVTSDVTIPLGQLESCQVTALTCASVTLLPDFEGVDLFRINSTIGPVLGSAFPAGTFQTFGISFDQSGSALLTVQSVTETTTLEPSSLSLLMVGIGALGFARLVRRLRLGRRR